MKKIKLLVIFFFGIIFVYVIYKYTYYDNNNILILGENININTNKYHITKYLYENITYKELFNIIKNDEPILLKGKNTSLNQLIAKSSIVIINANNVEYNKKCNKKNSLKKYNKKIEKERENLIRRIKKISNSRIIVVNNYCNQNNNKELNDKNLLDFLKKSLYNTQ